MVAVTLPLETVAPDNAVPELLVTVPVIVPAPGLPLCCVNVMVVVFPVVTVALSPTGPLVTV